jgi:hypothetical protein
MVVVKDITEVGMFTVTTATFLATAVKYNCKWVITLATGVYVITRFFTFFTENETK